jgi:two-component system sensor histidine kinase VicK
LFEEKEEDELKTDDNAEKTEILYGSDKIVKRAIDDFHKIKERFDNCTDSTGPFVFYNTSIWKEFVNLANRGIKLRFITEITKDNIPYCKELMKIAELRHLDEVKGNFGISDGNNYGGSASVREGQPPVEIMRSNVRAFVDQQQFFFETLWSKSISAEQKIKEIENGVEPIKTQLLQNPQDIFKATLEFYKKSNQIKSCFPVEGLNVIYRDFSNSRQEILDRYRQGKHKGIRWITSLKNKKDVELVKSHIDDGVKIRHVKDLLTDSFALSDKSFIFTIENIEKEKLITNVLSSNDKLYLDHYDTIFETLWKKGIDIDERINDIEEGHYVDVDLIPNPKESLKIFQELYSSIKSEVLLLLSSTNAFFRIENNNDFYACEKLTRRGITVKVLIPLKIDLLKKINQIILKYPKIEFRYFNTYHEPFIGISVIDREKVLILEIKNDTTKGYIESMGMTIFIEGKSAALSYASIFNSLWKQTEMYEQLNKTFLQLQIHEKMQKEFINVAAHELRTPLQPIISTTTILNKEIQNKRHKEFLDILDRNVHRLKTLSEDILDTAKIESNSLTLDKEHFKIGEIILKVIEAYENEAATKNIKFECLFYDAYEEDVIIYADKNRISQVITNLINNSIKFIPKEEDEEGIISISVNRRKNDDKDKIVIVMIKDNGTGIDDHVFPKLFTKFVSKSFQGTGLGLYICKSIVEAHGGKIWVKNNENGKGATIGFSLPFIS